MLKSGKLRGEVVQFPDGAGCCIWYPLPGDENEEVGIAFDFSYSDIGDLIALLQQMKATEPQPWTAPIYDPVDSATLVDDSLVERAPDWEALAKL